MSVLSHAFDASRGLPYDPAGRNDFSPVAFQNLLRAHAAQIKNFTGKDRVTFPDLQSFYMLAPPAFQEEFERVIGSAHQLRGGAYAYALNDDGNPAGYVAQPGTAAGQTWDGVASLARLPELLLQDGLTPINRADEAPAGTYPVAVSVNPDHSWLAQRRNADGTWSFGQGLGPVTSLDAGGNVIVDPFAANHDYGRVNYREPLGYYAVPFAGLVAGVPAAARTASLERGVVPDAPWAQHYFAMKL